MSTTRRSLVIAHRGHSTGAPEQTMAAFRAAVELGADMIEADVRRSLDGRLVLMHDLTLDRTTDGRGPVSCHDLAGLRALDAGGWFAPAFAGQRIPLLDELFDLADETGLALCLEAKGETAAEAAAIACAVGRAVQARQRLDRDFVAGFDHNALNAARADVPGLRTAPDRLPEHGPSDAATLLAQAKRAGAAVIQHHHADLTPQVVRAVQEAGVAVWAWPTTTAEEVARALSFGVAGLMGDDVATIAAAVRQASPTR